jgi:SpoVK/Ycf46/Vps4 family AAA+-type ATPase
VFNTKLVNHVPEGIYVETDKLERAQVIIKNLLWKRYKQASSLVMKMNKRRNASDAYISFETDDTIQSLPSERGTSYAKYLKRCVEANVARSVMLYGPPGTGKSTLARTLIKNLGFRSFRIRVEDIDSLENSTLFEAINIFEPDAIILDDFDRSFNQSALLETLEFFQHHVKLVIATVNDKDKLDEALLRPGRFDELILVDKMDDAVIKHTLGDYVDEYEHVKMWPIAFVVEYVKRRRFMDPAEAQESMIELANRVKRLEKYTNKNDIDVLLGTSTTKTKSNLAKALSNKIRK